MTSFGILPTRPNISQTRLQKSFFARVATRLQQFLLVILVSSWAGSKSSYLRSRMGMITKSSCSATLGISPQCSLSSLISYCITNSKRSIGQLRTCTFSAVSALLISICFTLDTFWTIVNTHSPSCILQCKIKIISTCLNFVSNWHVVDLRIQAKISFSISMILFTS